MEDYIQAKALGHTQEPELTTNNLNTTFKEK